MHPAAVPVDILLLSADRTLAEVIGQRMKEWLLAFRVREDWPGPGSGETAGSPLILLDVRENGKQALQWLRLLKSEDAGTEVILINRPERIEMSIAGMRAGAADELTVPIDTLVLREKIVAAILRNEQRTAGGGLTRFFHKTMSAITFAQAGEFDTARDFLTGSRGDAAPADNRKKKTRP